MHLPADIQTIVHNVEVKSVEADNEYTPIWNAWAQRLKDDATAKPDTDLLVNGSADNP